MTISKETWLRYVNKLAEVNAKASQLMIQYVQKNGFADVDELISMAFNLADHYGAAAAAAACDLYDAIAAAEGVVVPPAVPAQTATYGEVAKAVQGTMKKTPNLVPQTVGRLVKQAGADTMLQNAQRDGAQFAWVPHGDTCAFCMTLASRGWQYMSKKALKNGHAEHIHANCNCEYCVRFDGKSEVEGYDPDEYKQIYDEAEGNTPQEKINAIRRNINEKKKMDMQVSSNKRVLFDVTEEYYASAQPGKGSFTYEQGYDKGQKNANEIAIAKRIHYTFGGDMVLLTAANKNKIKTADYLWRNKLWDLKEPTTNKATDDRLRSGLHQIWNNPGGVIFDYKRNDFDMDIVLSIIENRAKRSKINTFDIIIISHDDINRVYRYIK